MAKYDNSRSRKLLDSIPQSSLESENCTVCVRSKFNFSFFDSSQNAGQNYSDWTGPQLAKLLEKIQHYSVEPLIHWERMKCGRGRRDGSRGSVLEIYGAFPAQSSFVHPKFVPHDVEWARFRLESDMRLIGFVVPSHLSNTEHQKFGVRFCRNTFYVVFLDAKHLFWKR